MTHPDNTIFIIVNQTDEETIRKNLPDPKESSGSLYLAILITLLDSLNLSVEDYDKIKQSEGNIVFVSVPSNEYTHAYTTFLH